MPETDDGATDFVLQGDTRLLQRAQAALAAAEASRRRPRDGRCAPWRSTRPARFDARPRAQALLLGLGFKRRRSSTRR